MWPQLVKSRATAIGIDNYDSHSRPREQHVGINGAVILGESADDRDIRRQLDSCTCQVLNRRRFASEFQIIVGEDDVSDDVGQHSRHPGNHNPYLHSIRHGVVRLSNRSRGSSEVSVTVA